MCFRVINNSLVKFVVYGTEKIIAHLLKYSIGFDLNNLEIANV